MLIQTLIESSESDFDYKLPPLNDKEIIKKIHLKANKLNSIQAILDQINSYFSQLKDEIIKKIDDSQKKAINQALQMPFGKEQILKRYQEISQIQNLKCLLVQEQNMSFDLYQKSSKDFIQKVEQQKNQNTHLLQELLNQCQKVQELVNFDRLNVRKSFILDFLDSLNAFEDQTQIQANYSSDLTNNSLKQQDTTKINKQIQLISNKTSDCSEELQLQSGNLDRLNLRKSFILHFLDLLNVFENQAQIQVNSNSDLSKIQLQSQDNSTKINK